MKHSLRAAAAALALLAAGHAHAQVGDVPVGSYSLPPRPAAAPSPAQGPVDSDVPAAVAVRPLPGEAPAAAALPTPSPTLSAAPVPARGREAARTVRTAPAPTPPPASAAPAAGLAAAPASASAPAHTSAPAAPPGDPAGSGWPWWWPVAAVLAALAIAIAAFLLRLRRVSTGIPAQRAAPSPGPATPPAPPAAPGHAASPARAALAEAPIAALRFEPQDMQLSMVYATLSYRLLVTNRGRDAAGPLAIAGDMIAAHRSLPVGEQLFPEHGALPPLHTVDQLAPGDTATLAGQLRLPLAEIRAVPIGGGPCFLPLVRIALAGTGIAARPHVFTLGLPAGRSDGALLALRMDRGFAFYRPLGQREIDTPPWLPLDAAGPAR